MQIRQLLDTYHEQRVIEAREWDVRFASMWWRYVNAHRKENSSPIPFAEMFPQLVGDPFERAVPAPQQKPDDTAYMLEMWAACQPEGAVKITRTPVVQKEA